MNLAELTTEDITLNVDIVSTSGISTCSPNYIVRTTLITPILTLGDSQITALQSIHGSIKVRAMNSTLEKLGEDIEAMCAHNQAVLEGSFILGSEHYCFSKDELKKFTAFSPNRFLITKISGKSLHPIGADLLEQLQQVFLQKMASIQADFDSGRLPEFQTVLSKLKGHTEV